MLFLTIVLLNVLCATRLTQRVLTRQESQLWYNPATLANENAWVAAVEKSLDESLDTAALLQLFQNDYGDDLDLNPPYSRSVIEEEQDVLLLLQAENTTNSSHSNNLRSTSTGSSSSSAASSHIDRIYYINMNISQGRRRAMEEWLGNPRINSVPYERVEAIIGDDAYGACEADKMDPKRCRGKTRDEFAGGWVALLRLLCRTIYYIHAFFSFFFSLSLFSLGLIGLARTNIHIMDSFNTTGHTLVIEDDYAVRNMTAVYESIADVPDDWDIIRWNCWGNRSATGMPGIIHKQGKHGYVIFRTAFTSENCTKKEDSEDDGSSNSVQKCWFCGGTHMALWKDSSIHKIRALWDKRPYNDIDCRLTTTEINSYCINFRSNETAVMLHIEGEMSYITEAE